jgi:peptidoglycan/LPS O-acetylase OafA/YrhL
VLTEKLTEDSAERVGGPDDAVDRPASVRAGPSKVRRIEELDGLRAVAILLVISCHYPGFCVLLGGFLKFGWVGVEIFFAISGYLITTILLGLRTKPSPYTTFYARRTIRILPVYLVVTVLLIPGIHYEHILQPRWYLFDQVFFLRGFTDPFWSLMANLFRHPLRSLLHLAPLSTGRALYYDNSVPRMFFTGAAYVSWSLSVEEFFYLLWAPVVLKLSRRWVTITAFVACAGALLLRWLLCAGLASYFWTACRFDGLMYGALVALVIESARQRQQLNRLFWACLGGSILGLAGIWIYLRPVLNHDPRTSLLFLTFGLSLTGIATASIVGILVTKAGRRWLVGDVLRWRMLVFVGTISYTMYLVHVAIATLIGGLPIGALGRACLALGLTIAVAYASWNWLELPLLQWKDKRFPNSPHPSEPVLSGFSERSSLSRETARTSAGSRS